MLDVSGSPQAFVCPFGKLIFISALKHCFSPSVTIQKAAGQRERKETGSGVFLLPGFAPVSAGQRSRHLNCYNIRPGRNEV